MPSLSDSALGWAIHNAGSKVRSFFARRPKPYKELSQLVGRFDITPPPHILLLGDSVTERVSRLDTDKRSLDAMVASRFKEQKPFFCISHSAYHAKVYQALLKILKVTSHRPKLVILPINMRSFSPQWDLEPSWQFDAEIRLLEMYASNRQETIPFLPLTHTTPEQYEVFDATEVEYPFTSLRRIGEFRLIINAKPQTVEQFNYRKKQIFIFHYLHELMANHVKVTSLIQISQAMREMGMSLLYYVTPVNYQAGDRFVGGVFSDLVRRNVDVIYQALKPHLDSENIRWVDLSMGLASDFFFNPDDPTEHLNQSGRSWLSFEIFHASIEMLDLKGNRGS